MLSAMILVSGLVVARSRTCGSGYEELPMTFINALTAHTLQQCIQAAVLLIKCCGSCSPAFGICHTVQELLFSTCTGSKSQAADARPASPVGVIAWPSAIAHPKPLQELLRRQKVVPHAYPDRHLKVVGI